MRNFLFALPLAALAACASDAVDREYEPGGPDDPRRGAEVDRICFTSSISGFNVVSRDAIVVRRGVRDRYLLTLSGTCNARDAFIKVGLRSRGGSCLSRLDEVLVDDAPGGVGGRCTIDRIYEWNPDAEKEAESDEAETSDDA